MPKRKGQLMNFRKSLLSDFRTIKDFRLKGCVVLFVFGNFISLFTSYFQLFM